MHALSANQQMLLQWRKLILSGNDAKVVAIQSASAYLSHVCGPRTRYRIPRRIVSRAHPPPDIAPNAYLMPISRRRVRVSLIRKTAPQIVASAAGFGFATVLPQVRQPGAP